MKRKYSIISLTFALLVVSAILLQSIHSFYHLEKFIAEKHCHHKYTENKTEINHQHHGFDHCFVCEFALSNYTPSQQFTFSFKKEIEHKAYIFAYSKQITQSFRGALFALRAPPKIIV